MPSFRSGWRPVHGPADVAGRRMVGRDARRDRAAGSELPSRRQVERRHQHEQFPHASPRPRATSSIRARFRSAHPDQPYNEGTNPGYTALCVCARLARLRRVRRRERRHAACIRRHNDERWQGNLGLYSQDTLWRGRSKRYRPRFDVGLSAWRAYVPAWRHTAVLAQVLCQRDTASLGHRFHQYERSTFRPPATGNDWRTILVGGLGAGGRSIYALDVTNRSRRPDTEASIASRGACCGSSRSQLARVRLTDLGEDAAVRVGRPDCVRVQQSWRQRLPLCVESERLGALLKKLGTGAGSDTAPSGLSTIRAFVGSRKDPYVLQAMAATLGNVWRFDLSSPTDVNGKSSSLRS